MKLPNLRATRVVGCCVCFEHTDRQAQRTSRQRRRLIQNRVTRLEFWMEQNGINNFKVSVDKIYFDAETDATLFFMTFA